MATTNADLAFAALRALNQVGVRFALLHGAERLASGDISDIDVVVDREPISAFALTAAAWKRCGLIPVIIWPYDVGGTTTLFLSVPDASEGVQLDMLYDPRAVGKYAVHTTPLLATANFEEELPRISDAASLVYQWRKRRVKGQDDRLASLRRKAATVDELELRSVSAAVTGDAQTAVQLISELPPSGSRRLPRHPLLAIRRIGRRLIRPIGFWGHAENDSLGHEVAARFARFLPVTRSQATPSRPREPAWWATEVMPVRFRPGIFLSTGRRPSWAEPDLVVTSDTVDGAARDLTTAMSSRLS